MILTGCIHFNTGQISFTQDPDCIYTGCLVTTGLHAGQIAVTVNTPYCDDIYYGCVDWSTGQFKVNVPSDCCEQFPYEVCPCAACAETGGQHNSISVSYTGSGFDVCWCPSYQNCHENIGLDQAFSGSTVCQLYMDECSPAQGDCCIYVGEDELPASVTANTSAPPLGCGGSALPTTYYTRRIVTVSIGYPFLTVSVSVGSGALGWVVGSSRAVALGESCLGHGSFSQDSVLVGINKAPSPWTYYYASFTVNAIGWASGQLCREVQP